MTDVCIDPGLKNMAWISWDRSTSKISEWRKRDLLAGAKCRTKSLDTSKTISLVMDWLGECFPDADHTTRIFVEAQMVSRFRTVSVVICVYFRMMGSSVEIVGPVAWRRKYDMITGGHSTNKLVSVSRMLQVIKPEEASLMPSSTRKLDDLADVWWMRKYVLDTRKSES